MPMLMKGKLTRFNVEKGGKFKVDVGQIGDIWREVMSVKGESDYGRKQGEPHESSNDRKTRPGNFQLATPLGTRRP